MHIPLQTQNHRHIYRFSPLFFNDLVTQEADSVQMQALVTSEPRDPGHCFCLCFGFLIMETSKRVVGGFKTQTNAPTVLVLAKWPVNRSSGHIGARHWVSGFMRSVW